MKITGKLEGDVYTSTDGAELVDEWDEATQVDEIARMSPFALGRMKEETPHALAALLSVEVD